MDREKIVEKIIEKMPEKIKKGNGNTIYDNMMKARYLYLEICKNCHYDAEYNISSISTQKEIFNEHKVNEEKAYNVGVCNDFSIIGVELFKRMGLKAVALDVDGNEYKDGDKMSNPVHIYFVFSIGERDYNGNERFYLADPSFDLKRVQIGCATKYFATNPITVKNKKGYDSCLDLFSQSEIKQIDKKIGYCKEEYTDEIVRNIIKESEDLDLENKSEFENIVYKVENMLKNLHEKVFSNFEQDIGISDRQSAYKMIFYKAFPKEMDKGNIDFNIHKNQKGELISNLIIQKGKDKKEYIYSNGGYILDQKEK